MAGREPMLRTAASRRDFGRAAFESSRATRDSILRSDTFVKVTAFIDGAARGNPGPAGAGAYFAPAAPGEPAGELFLALGRATNNEAEYRALLLALEEARRRGADEVTIFSDSLLLVEQIKGRFRVKAENLKPLAREALERARAFPKFSISHVRREKNRDADRLANLGADGSEAA